MTGELWRSLALQTESWVALPDWMNVTTELNGISRPRTRDFDLPQRLPSGTRPPHVGEGKQLTTAVHYYNLTSCAAACSQIVDAVLSGKGLARLQKSEETGEHPWRRQGSVGPGSKGTGCPPEIQDRALLHFPASQPSFEGSSRRGEELDMLSG